MELPFSSLQTPCYVVDEALLERNLVILKQVIEEIEWNNSVLQMEANTK